MGNVFQVRYPELETISHVFHKQAEEIASMKGNLTKNANRLIEGDWRGEGERAFTTTFQSDLLPAWERLEDALSIGETLTHQLIELIRDAEEQAAQVFDHDSVSPSDPIPVNPAHPSQSNNPSIDWPQTTQFIGEWLLAKEFLGHNALGWLNILLNDGRQLWTDYKSIARGFLGGVRFTRDADGVWKVLGPRAARAIMGLNPYVNSFKDAYVKKHLLNQDTVNLVKALVKPGQFASAAKGLISTIGPSTLKAMKEGLPFDIAIDLVSNTYEFGWGKNKDQGLLSRKFFTYTSADLSATVAISLAGGAAGAAAGSVVPGIGTAVGFVTGFTLSVAYNLWGKEAWRATVDNTAGKWVQDNAPAVIESVKDFGANMNQGAQDVMNTLGENTKNFRNSLSQGLNSVTRWVGI